MGKDYLKKFVTKGVQREIHGIIQMEVWKGWAEVKKGLDTPGDYMATINLIVNEANPQKLHIMFIDEKKTFNVTSPFAVNNAVVIVAYDGQEVMMLNQEARELLSKVEEYTEDGGSESESEE